MAVRDRIIAYLRQHPEGIDDDALALALGLSARQRSNQECRRMEQQGLVLRRRVDGKIRNFLSGTQPQTRADAPSHRTTAHANAQAGAAGRPWHWEGNVQATVVSYLAARGCRITRVADTASRERGKDIVASVPSGQELWVSVKGYPTGTEKTNAHTMARHLFAGALYDLIAWRADAPTVALAIALPDFSTYRNLAQRIAWLLPTVNAALIWVAEDGSVQEEGSSQ
ncbi:MAG: MarR family transcriptional regulator [Chloroflexi bacterium]|nr:MarR family transcriptional regulator [Chloroflexota bacterium]